jgi:asparagine synthetase B (glutamine-hydrolysing)
MSGINTFKIIHNSDFKVILEGQGADEQHAGYLRYLVNYLYHIKLNRLFIEFSKIKKIHGNNRYLKLGILFSLIGKIIGKKFLLKVT